MFNFLRQAKQQPLTGMWIDGADANERLSRTACSDIVRQALSDLMTTGIAIIPQNLSGEACDKILADFRAYCAEHPVHADFCDEHGLHDRLANLPLYSAAARQVALNRTVLEVVETAFGKPADIVGSLYFERGSGQNIHRDTPAFYTIPLNNYFGVWHALEDIHPDSGVLTYYEGGHHVAPDREYVGSNKMESYFTEVESACLSHGLPKRKVVAKKGDTIIWHPELPHGGSEIIDKSKSRRSIVYHYKKTGLPIYGTAAFFGDQGRLSQKDKFRYKDIGGRKYVDHGEPKFFLNRKEGNFKEQIAKA